VIPPTLAALGRLARTEKERAVKRGEDTWHFVDVYRAGQRILRVAVPDGDDVAGLLYNAPAPLCADYIAMAADAWGSRDPANPITGQGWRRARSRGPTRSRPRGRGHRGRPVPRRRPQGLRPTNGA